MKKFLVIENCAKTRNLILKSLEAEGFYTIGAENGLVGIQRAQEQLPDLICGLAISQLDGHDILTTLPPNPVIAIIPVIILPTKTTEAESCQVMNLGADDYLTKFCTTEELLRAISTCLEKQARLLRWIAQTHRVPEPLPTDTASQAAPESIFPPVCHPKVREAFDYIGDNYRLYISVNKVAEVVGYSESYLNRLVKKETGKTAHDWIVECQMEEACRLLLQTNQSIERIAEAVGCTPVHLHRQFLKFYKTTPKTWRTMHRSA